MPGPRALDEIQAAQGWTDETVLALILDWLGMHDDAYITLCEYLEDVAHSENEEG
jgi:NADH:ubiquinone oxidoreductase subunit E